MGLKFNLGLRAGTFCSLKSVSHFSHVRPCHCNRVGTLHWNTVKSNLISECFASKIKPCKGVHGIRKIFVADKN